MDLIKVIAIEMMTPFEKLTYTEKYTRVVNEDGGNYSDIVFSILASVLCSCIKAFSDSLKLENFSDKESFVNMLTIVSSETMRAYEEHESKKGFH